jgi:HPt (histidine-containing phosphotransfer) domain-containing protein
VEVYLTKPIDIPLLLESIDNLIGETSCDTESAESVNSDAQPAQHGELLNLLVLNQLNNLGKSPDFIERLVDHFQDDTDELISRMHLSLHSQKYRKLIDEAHGVKGAAGNIGATKLAHTAQQINRATPDMLARDGAEYLKQLQNDFNASVEMMRAYCAKKA